MPLHIESAGPGLISASTSGLARSRNISQQWDKFQRNQFMLATINNWRLSSKMTMAFTLIGVLLISVAASGVFVNRYLGEIVERNVSHNLVATAVIGEVLAQVREQRIIVYSRHNAVDDAEVAKLTTRLKKNQQALLAAVAQTRTVADASLQPGVDKLEGLVTTLNAVAVKTFAVRASQPLADSLVLIKTAGKDASHDAIDQAELLLKQTIDAAHSANASGKSYAAGALTLAVSLSALALAGLVGIWYLISRTVARPMADLATVTTMLADGHHVAVPSLLRGDELGKIACAVQSFSDAAARRAETDAATAAELSGVTTALADSLKAMSDGNLTKAVTADFPPTYSGLKTDFNQTLSSLASLIG
ncbi:MAG: HAMP domain-containing protein, partial [Janthinobacterium lividum]